MSTELNLLPSEAKFLAAKRAWQKKANLLSTVIGTLWLLVLLIVFAVWFFYQNKLKTENANLITVKNKYQAISEDVLLTYQVKQRTKLIADALSKRYEYNQLLEKIKAFFPEVKDNSAFEIKDKSTFNFKGQTYNGSDIDELEKKVDRINDGRDEVYASAKLISLGISGGIWSFNVEVKVK